MKLAEVKRRLRIGEEGFTGHPKKLLPETINGLRVAGTNVIFNMNFARFFKLSERHNKFVFAQDEDKPEDWYVHVEDLPGYFKCFFRKKISAWHWVHNGKQAIPPLGTYEIDVMGVVYDDKLFFKLKPYEITNS